MSQKLRLSGDFDFKLLAKMTPGFVGADLNALVTTAGIATIKRIFETLNSGKPESKNVEQKELSDLTSVMEIDNEEPASSSTVSPTKSAINATSTLQDFLRRFPSPLTDHELQPFAITIDDFLVSIPKIQPSSKREGFATVPDVTWQDIGALQGIRLELQMAIVEPILHPENYESVGISTPTGVLLWGPPGCGKTLLAKAVANESRANFISVKGPELLNKV